MTETEVLLIKQIVESCIKDALYPLKEELSKIKALSAKILKEGASAPKVQEVMQEGAGFRQLPKANYNNVAKTLHEAESKKSELSSLKAQAAPFVNADGMLPDVDIDPSLFLKR